MELTHRAATGVTEMAERRNTKLDQNLDCSHGTDHKWAPSFYSCIALLL